MYVQVRGGRCAKRSLVCLERAMARKPANMTRVHICDGGGPTRGEAGESGLPGIMSLVSSAMSALILPTNGNRSRAKVQITAVVCIRSAGLLYSGFMLEGGSRRHDMRLGEMSFSVAVCTRG